jgi:hypothetical protein
MSSRAKSGRRAGTKKQESPVRVPKRPRVMVRRDRTPPKSKETTTLREILMAKSEVEDVYDESEDSDSSEESAGVTPTEEGSGARRKRGDLEDSSGASDDEIKDDDEVEPSNASATKFAIKKHGETATEVEENAVAYMATRVAKFVKTTLFKMVKSISDDELGQIAMGLVMDDQKIPPSGREGFSNQYMKVLLDTLNKERGRCQQELGYIVLSEFYGVPIVCCNFCCCTGWHTCTNNWSRCEHRKFSTSSQSE